MKHIVSIDVVKKVAKIDHEFWSAQFVAKCTCGWVSEPGGMHDVPKTCPNSR